MNGLLEVLMGGEMPSNQAYGNYTGINTTGMPNYTSNLSLGNTSATGGLFNDMNLGDWGNLASTIFSMYQGNQQMGLLKDILGENLAMAKERQGWTRDELDRVNRTRNTLNSGYRTGNYAPSPTAKTYS